MPHHNMDVPVLLIWSDKRSFVQTRLLGSMPDQFIEDGQLYFQTDDYLGDYYALVDPVSKKILGFNFEYVAIEPTHLLFKSKLLSIHNIWTVVIKNEMISQLIGNFLPQKDYNETLILNIGTLIFKGDGSEDFAIAIPLWDDLPPLDDCILSLDSKP